MSVAVEFAVPTEDVALARTFEAVPSLTVEIERTAVDPRGRVMPYLWTDAAPNPNAVGRALRADPTTTAVAELDRTDGGTLYRVRWTKAVRETVGRLLSGDAVVVSGSATDRGWEFRLRFERRGDLAALRRTLDCGDVDARLRLLHPTATPPVDGRFALTDKQREALTAALDAGYYSVPREATLSELAADLDITAQALSKRLRRGNEALCRHALITGPE